MQQRGKGIFIYFFLLLFFFCNSDTHLNYSTFKVTRDKFVISVVETGELKAIRSTMIEAPDIERRFGELKITRIIDEGTEVQTGDTLIQFDQTEVQKSILDVNAELEIAKAELEKMKAEQKSRLEDLEADLKIVEISYEIAKLQLGQATYEAEIKKKEIELSLHQAEISLLKSKEQIENQKKILFEELNQQQIKIDQLNEKKNEAKNNLADLTVLAPTPGLTIIEKSWHTGNKWRVGDQTWPGWPVISLPDLSEIKAETEINEIDISKIRQDQPVQIKLDAFPDTTFSGKITDIATLARRKNRTSQIKVFPVEIHIQGRHKMLLPGMTVSCEIIVDEFDNVLSVPLDAVFYKNEAPHVQKVSGSSLKETMVELGPANNDFVIIEKGLKENDLIALFDPLQKASKAGNTKNAVKK